MTIPQVVGGVKPPKLTNNTHYFEESETTAAANITAGAKVCQCGRYCSCDIMSSIGWNDYYEQSDEEQ